ncbi:LuxR C-terminal-related transcriptional regulator [Defluviimonas sp. D31]|uniref:LuxR C-terminal-related transcriptional regulator n=1 Tax=Defluviimonas sp. D31 TaxID=3083253 RepID=UPI00296F2457|nr:LuxR C-terminal-related transcriptional regulator [Defluviimonas sp. D31]MDW4550289.1 LuxR C-terminal-related transcriptional regulator [Defluviimonas sp. D31]
MSEADRSGAIVDGDSLRDYATAAYMTGREDTYLDLMGRAFDAYTDTKAPREAARTAFWIGLTLLFRHEHGRGGGWLARAGHVLQEAGTDCAEAGYLLLPKVETSFGAGDNHAAVDFAQKALEIGERYGDEDLSAIARHLVGRAQLALGDLHKGLSSLDETMVATTEGRLSPIVTGLIYCSVIEACQRYQILRRASEWTEALSSWCAKQPELVAFTGRCLIHRSEILMFDGRWPEAESEARVAIKRLTAGPAAHHAGPAHYQQGELHRLRGAYDAADESYRKASALGFDPQPGLALMRLRQGSGQSAAAAIRRALAATDAPTERMRLLGAAVEIALGLKKLDEARAFCEEMQALAETYPSDAVAASLAEMQGDLAAQDDLPEQAVKFYARSTGLWRNLACPYRLARVRLRSARACGALGDVDGAMAEARAAGTAFASLGAEPERQDADALIRELAHGEASILTRRQTEVLHLVTKGLTNREIAGQLGLSERTVDRHVSDILTRIDAPTRAAASAWAITNKLTAPGGSG